VRSSVGKRNRQAFVKFVAAVNDQMSLEHYRGLEGSEAAKAATARLDEALGQYTSLGRSRVLRLQRGDDQSYEYCWTKRLWIARYRVSTGARSRQARDAAPVSTWSALTHPCSCDGAIPLT
jgi:hypothetical protein